MPRIDFKQIFGTTLVREAVDGDLVAAEWKNTQPNAATSTNETIQHRWFFGALGSEIEAARVTVGKVNDFTPAADEDAFATWSVRANGALAEAIRIEGGSALVPAGDPRIVIGGTPGTARIAPLQIVSNRTVNPNAFDLVIENAAITSSKLLMRGTADGVIFQASGSGNLAILEASTQTFASTVSLFRLVAGPGGGSGGLIGADIIARNTGDAGITITSDTGDAVLRFRNGLGGFAWRLLTDASNTNRFTMATGVSGAAVLVIGAENKWGLGNPGGGLGDAPAPSNASHMLHLRTADTDGGFENMSMMRFDHFRANAAAQLGDKMLHDWFFGKPTPIRAFRMEIGKIEDFTTVAKESAFMAWSVKADGTLVEAIRMEGGSAFAPAGEPRVIIGGTPVNPVAGALQVVSNRTSGAIIPPQADLVVENAAVTNTRIHLRRVGLTGMIIQLSGTSTLSIIRDSTGLLSTFNCGVVNAGTGGGTVFASQVNARSTGVATIGVNSGSGSDARIIFRIGLGGNNSTLLVDASNSNAFTISDLGVAVTDPHSMVIGLEHKFGFGNPRVGASNAPAPLVPTHMHHLRTADTDGGPTVLAVWRFDSFIANAGANLNPTLRHAWHFGKPSPILAVEMTIGKTEDFTVVANESAFQKWEIKDDGVLSEILRWEGGGGLKFAFFGKSPTVLDTGWTAFANLVTDRTLDADATTVGEVADVLGTLIEKLKDKGILSV